MKKYFYDLLFKYLSFYVFKDDSVLIVNPVNNRLLKKFSTKQLFYTKGNKPSTSKVSEHNQKDTCDVDYILINGGLHYERDIHSLLMEVRKLCSQNTRIIITYYSALWKPFIKLATLLKLRSSSDEGNWIAPEDLENFLLLSDFEEIHRESHVLLPFYIPLVSNFVNRFVAPLPIFSSFCMLNISVARPVSSLPSFDNKPSVSVIVAARNEEGNIDNIIDRLPVMGPADELIFVEGNSTDNTWKKIQEVTKNVTNKPFSIISTQQDGVGKGDAVRKGFDIASKEILMILDADLTVPPEDLPQFYNAIVSGKGEYINGSRLVYPMEKEAMRFFNILGNKFFAIAFSFVLGQRFKDTLCGTKVMTRENYRKLAAHRSYFGDFDPFGDFDLIFGAARLGLKIVEIPISYRERTYGDTNISRWKHGLILLRMLIFAGRKIKFI